jgi:hypothetical protein
MQSGLNLCSDIGAYPAITLKLSRGPENRLAADTKPNQASVSMTIRVGQVPERAVGEKVLEVALPQGLILGVLSDFEAAFSKLVIR